MYTHMYSVFIENDENAQHSEQEILKLCESDDVSYDMLIDECHSHQSYFQSFLNSMSQKDPNWHFWTDFIHQTFSHILHSFMQFDHKTGY